MLAGLGKQRVILGLPWLRDENLRIDWKAGTVQLREGYPINGIEIEEEDVDDPSLIISFIQGEFTEEVEEIWDINALTKSTVLAAQENAKKETRTLEEMVPEEYHKYLDVFSEKEATQFPQSQPWDHKIDLKPTFQPKSSKIYPLSQEEEKLVQTFLDENLSKGYIRHSESPMALPLFFVAKKDGKKRPCQDYRYLNEHTIKNAYPLPLISDLMDKLKGKKYFSKFDIRWGYNNVRIRNGDQWKAAFKTKFGLYEPMVMFFGLCNSPATFQSMMDHIFVMQVGEGWIIVYMDAILICDITRKGIKDKTRKVLEIVRGHSVPPSANFQFTPASLLN